MKAIPGMLLLVTGAPFFCVTLRGLAQEKKPPPAAVPSEPADKRVFVRPNVPVSRFTPENTALLQPECDRIATFLARYAAEKYTEGVLRGEAAAMNHGRLLLAVSQHLQPANGSAVHCATRWLDGKAPTLAPPEDNLRVFSGFLLSASRRQADNPTQAQQALARILVRLAADIDPENEDAVYASEIQDRDGKAPPFKELLNGTLGNGWK